MHRIDGPGATVDKKFTEGDPAGGVQATVVTDDWLNDVQENIMKVLSAAGVTAVKGRDQDLLDALLGVKNIARFTSSGSFTVPAGVTKLWVSGCAAGGGGGFSSNTTANVSGGGGGGGAGQALIRTPFTVTSGQVIAITIGSGGGSGTNGGNTVIGSLATLLGGTAGNPGSNGTAGTAFGGIGGGGFPKGSDGHDAGNLAGTGNGGVGAGGPFGSAGGASRSAFGGTPLPGGPAGGFGCGGGGAGGQSSNGTQTGALGGTGSPGLVIFEW